jgi:hypothetical protein
VSTSPNESEFAALARKMLKGVHFKWIYLIRLYLDMIKLNCFAAHPDDEEEAQKLHLRTVLYALQSILPGYEYLHGQQKIQRSEISLELQRHL